MLQLGPPAGQLNRPDWKEEELVWVLEEEMCGTCRNMQLCDDSLFESRRSAESRFSGLALVQGGEGHSRPHNLDHGVFTFNVVHKFLQQTLENTLKIIKTFRIKSSQADRQTDSCCAHGKKKDCSEEHQAAEVGLPDRTFHD